MKTIVTIILALAISSCTSTSYRGPEIRNRIADDSELAAHTISIEEEPAGNIILSGNVASESDRNRIEKIARDTDGVDNLRSNLVVDSSSVLVRKGHTPPANINNDDRYIVSDLTSQLSNSAMLRDYDIQVESFGSTVTLRGEVGNESERMAAEQIARNTRGVRAVRNELYLNNHRY